MKVSKYSSENHFAFSQSNVLSLLDFCKGFAILGVFLFHYPLPNFSFDFGWQGVPIFIVLSGLGLTYSCLKKKEISSWKEWYIKRAERIIPAYWMAVLLGLIVMISLRLLGLIDGFMSFIAQAILNLFLLQNFHHKTADGIPNNSLWFVPLIISFYLVFPYLYTRILKGGKAKNYVSILLGALAVEFIYRAFSLYYLDGHPIGYHLPGLPVDKLPITFPFQGIAPFGFFPSRIAEFMLGMLGAVLLFKNNEVFNKVVLNIWTGIAGVLIWSMGNALIGVGLGGWVFSGFFIALGLILWVLNLGEICKHRIPSLFVRVSQIGKYSYYIFLTHFLFINIARIIEPTLIGDANSQKFWMIKLCMLFFIILGTGISSWLIMNFEKSNFVKRLTKRIVQKLALS